MPQVPDVAPAAMLQTPPQQSGEFEQTSPVWMQNDEPIWHVPFEQSFEQHSALSPQALPDVLHAALSGLQTPPTH
jgi:hypothetical protein